MYEIREAEDSDLPDILAIHNDAVLNSTAIWVETTSTLEDRRAWLVLRRSQGYPVLVAVEDGHVLGYGSFGDFRPYEGFRGSIEHSIYIAPGAHRRGIGRNLLAQLLTRAQALGKRVAVAAIDSTNAASIALHESFGFREVGRMPRVGEKFGRTLDMVLMQRDLE